MIAVIELSKSSAGVEELVGDLDAYLSKLYPAESNHLTSLEELFSPKFVFLGAVQEGVLTGCCGASIENEGYAELKRMYVSPAKRGLGIAESLLREIESKLVSQGVSTFRLETGIKQHEAIRFYEKHGYKEIGPFGSYKADPLSVFYEKTACI